MREQGIFFCTEDVKLLSKKGNYAMLKTEDYRLAVQSLSAKGVIFRNCKQQVTYTDLFQYSLVIIGIITLCFLHKN